ncbi:hypothetical protein BJ138DRAFT_1088159 [Hygrophoropsis aurantiaca]|uniref:Uncharacterized protein n=1 Tax=Hygrophoropsis aurantiaca TaxID=72124 RepID=A0ACB8AB08_9AGAM|nr:hypothetical protein BJ138DRAFT_1088159 [Hygrophoropsis aurantiaca]
MNILKSLHHSDNVCEICNVKPKYVDKNGVRHPYCSRTCAQDRPEKTIQTCMLDDCKLAGASKYNGFCSENHAKKGGNSAVKSSGKGLLSKLQEVGISSGAEKPPTETSLREIYNSSTVWREFVREWSSEWRTTHGSATVEKLYEISYPSEVAAEKDAYRQKLESLATNLQWLRTFHASQCICDIGTKGPKLCSWNSCGICNVVRSAFKNIAFGAPYNKGRYGDGLYSSKNPARADIYATSCLSSPFRVMIACDVLLHKPPTKSSTVVHNGQVVVRVAEAMIPRYIVMYTKHGQS